MHYFVDIADFGIYDGVYDIEMTTNFDDELDLEKLYKISKTDNTVTSSEYNEYVSLYSYNEDILYSSEYANSFSSKDNSMPELTPVLNFIDDESYLQLLERENLDKAKFTNREKPLAIIYNKKSFRNYNINKSYFLPYLDESMTKLPVMYPKQKEGYESYPNLKGKLIIRYNLQDRSDCIYEKFDDNMLYSTLDIGTYIQSPILSTSGSMHQYQIDIIYPKSLMNEVLKDFESEELNINKMMHFTSANPKVLYDKLLKNAENMGINKRFLFVKLGTADDYNRMNQMIQTICYGFIILISLIAAANVFNTISMNASLYRREFAIMKSVGMTGGGLRKMLSFECIVLGIRALLFGLPLSVVFTYRIYRFFDFDMGTDFYIPWQAIVIAASGVFTVAFVSMMYAIHKAKNENIIDTLKNENF